MMIRKAKAVMRLALLCLLAWMPSAAAGGETCTLPGGGNSDWEETFRQDGIRVYAMKTSESGIMALRAAGVLNAPVDQIMEVLRRVEIADQWMPDIVHKFVIQEKSDLEAVTYSVNTLPWPFAGRELILNNALRLDPDGRHLVVDVYSVERSDIPVKEGAVRAVMHCGETRIRPEDPRRTEVDIILFVDPKGAIPAWLANFAQRRMPYNFLRSLERQAATTRFPLRPAFRRLLEALEAGGRPASVPKNPIAATEKTPPD